MPVTAVEVFDGIPTFGSQDLHVDDEFGDAAVLAPQEELQPHRVGIVICNLPLLRDALTAVGCLVSALFAGIK